MTKIQTSILSAGLFSLAITAPAAAQFYGGSNNYAPASSQAYARGLSGSGDQGGNLRSFSVGGGGGFWGGGGSNAATPWSNKYGANIQPAIYGSVLSDSIARQQANFQGAFQNQDLELRRLQLKQATFDEMAYEKMNTPPPELVREEMRQSQLTRARRTPPDNEITSGQALNSMLVNVQQIQAREGVRGYSIPLDPETVQHLNVTTTGESAGSNQFFKNKEIADWPIAFSTDAFAADRKRVDDDFAALVKAQQAGKVDGAKVVDARKMIGSLKSRLFSMRFEQSFTDYSEALGYLTKLGNAVDILAKPGGGNFVNGTYSAKGSTVGEVLDYMTSKGLRFAQATPGFESYYLGFYQQLVTYDIGISRIVGDQSTMMYQPAPPPSKDKD